MSYGQIPQSPLTFDFIRRLLEQDLEIDETEGYGNPELQTACRTLLSIGINPALKGEDILQATFWLTNWMHRAQNGSKLDMSRFKAFEREI